MNISLTKIQIVSYFKPFSLQSLLNLQAFQVLLSLFLLVNYFPLNQLTILIIIYKSFSKQEMNQQRKQKLIKKYLQDEKQTIKSNKPLQSNYLIVKDNQNLEEVASSQSSDQQKQDSQENKRKRVYSSDEENVITNSKKKDQIGDDKKSKKLRKSIRKALGIKKEDEIEEFLKEIKVDGMDIKELEQYLKQQRHKIIESESFPSKEKKVAKEKRAKNEENVKRVKNEENIKMQNMYDSEQSDLVIPEQARTIYRNKDGTIKQHTDKQLKLMREKQVTDRLAEWEEGMKKGGESEEDLDEEAAFAKRNNWDDPLKIWGKIQVAKKPFSCKYEGYANRFNIKPGHRWDGVIRGNGFQTTYLQEQNNKKLKTRQEQREYMKNL